MVSLNMNPVTLAPNLSWLLLVLLLSLHGRPVALGQGSIESSSFLFEQDDEPSEFLLEGPAGVDQQIDYWEDRPSLFGDQRSSSFSRWRDRMDEECGIDFGFNGYMLYQAASRRDVEDDNQAFGGIYRLQGSWSLFRDTSHLGRFEFRLEGRDALSQLPSPTTLASGLGIRALNSGYVYATDFESVLTVFRWAQTFLDGQVAISGGVHAFDVHQDVYPFQTIGRAFLNRAFIVNPAIGTTTVGAFAIITKVELTEHIWTGYQMYDANAKNGVPFWDSMQSNEWLRSVELGWTPSPDRYLTDRILLTVWQRDAVERTSAQSGWGFAISASRQLNDPLLAFLRVGHNDGGGGVQARNAFSTGFEYAFDSTEAFAFGFGWASPPGLSSEYVMETSYRVQATPHLSITPDLQFILDPATSERRSVLAASLRMILSI
ncbi:MAG: carbohydrate porin [Rubripirellula sp.]